MKLSIIVPVYKRGKILKRFLDRMADQKNNNYELIVVVDTKVDKVLDILNSLKENIKGELKIIFNTSRIGRTLAIKAGIKKATGDRVVITSASNIFKNNMVDEVISLIDKFNADIIEFKASIKQPFKFEGRNNQIKSKVLEIKENPSIIAYSSPFEFNKIYKRDVLLKVFDTPSLMTVNSRFSIEIVYKAFLISKTYASSNEKIIISKSENTNTFNPLKILRQWKTFSNLLEKGYNNIFYEEFQYAQYFHETVVLFALTGALKNKILLNKMSIYYDKKIKNEFNNFFETNQYILNSSPEAKLLHSYSSSSELTKLYKEFK